MCRSTITCEQAIFTSIRTPMGEGYRIIAASKGLGPADKQTITKNSPSHGGLCHPQGASQPADGSLDALAFYPLADGRLCVALSCCAGAEHTGRGGERIYTHNLILPADSFEHCGFNPFALARAFVQQGLFVPQLKPPTALPTVEIPVGHQQECDLHIQLVASMHETIGPVILDRLLNHSSLVLNLPEQWIQTAEALMLGIPGPLRQKVSFAAGLRFSLGRGHRLHLVFDDTPKTKNSVRGQTVDFVDPADAAPPTTAPSRWAAFVARHWREKAMTKLGRRTSRTFDDVASAEARDFVAKLYDDCDTTATSTTTQLLPLLREHLGIAADRPESDLRATVLKEIASSLTNRLATSPPSELQAMWNDLLACWKLDTQESLVTAPAIETTMRRLMGAEPVAACAMALDLLAHDVPKAQPLRRVMDESLNALTQHLRHDPTACEQAEIRQICRKFHHDHPDWPAVHELCQTLETCGETQPAPSIGRT